VLHTHRFCRLRPNLLGTDYVVGDVHGQWPMLQALLAAVGFDRSKDRLFSVGDLIDKGPDSEACLELLRTWRCFHAVLGNHEWMLRETHRGSEYAASLWERNEGEWLDQSDTLRFDWLRRLVDGMPIAVEVPLRDGRRLGIIHAEVPRGWSWSEVKRRARVRRSRLPCLSGWLGTRSA
jgi:serine/threonine protein phosphatase 1